MATYDPQRAGIPSNKGAGVLGKPADSRSWIVDDSFNERNFNSTAEAIAYFDTSIKRQGRFSVYITVSGSTTEWWWKDGTSDAQLVQKVTGIESIGPTFSNNLSDI